MKERQRHRQIKKQAPCREPDVGLNPRTPGSQPEQKADAQPLSHSGIPEWIFLILIFMGNFLKILYENCGYKLNRVVLICPDLDWESYFFFSFAFHTL